MLANMCAATLAPGDCEKVRALESARSVTSAAATTSLSHTCGCSTSPAAARCTSPAAAAADADPDADADADADMTVAAAAADESEYAVTAAMNVAAAAADPTTAPLPDDAPLVTCMATWAPEGSSAFRVASATPETVARRSSDGYVQE
jgi:hypothetical protein